MMNCPTGFAVRRAPFLAALLSLACAATSRAQSIELTPSHPDGIYAAGEKATFAVTVKGDAKTLTDVQYRFRPSSIATPTFSPLDLTAGSATLTTTSEKPGTVMVEVTAKTPDGKPVRAVCGAVFSPNDIAPSMPRPADFDAFWSASLADLAQIPPNPKADPFESVDGLQYAHVTLDNINNSHVNGQLARPAAPGKYPAIVIFQYAGVYPLQRNWVLDKAKSGFLCLNIIAHDLPIDLPADKYKELADGPLKGYAMIGNQSRDTSYFRRMVLGTVRAVDYVASRDDWDGQTLLVTGNSQGGFQSIACASLSPRVTAVITTVPAGSDTTAVSAGRALGWPYWKGDDNVMNTSRYYDPINFASHIRCPTLIGVGLADVTATPTGVIAMFNQIPAKEKRLVTIPRSEHKGPSGDFPAVVQSWQSAAQTHHPFPIAP